MIVEPDWVNVAILIYVAGFFAVEGLWLKREGFLGHAMFAKCLVLTWLFSYAALREARPDHFAATWPRDALRVALAIVLTITVVALVTTRRREEWAP